MCPVSSDIIFGVETLPLIHEGFLKTKMRKAYHFKLFLLMFILALGFGALFIVSADGFFFHDVALRVRFREPRNLVFTGQAKNLLCFSGVLLSAAMLSVPAVILVNKAWLPGNKPKIRKNLFLNKAFPVLVLLSFLSFMLSYFWQVTLFAEIYR